MADERKKEKTRRENYFPLEAKAKSKKTLAFGKKLKAMKKKEKIDENAPSPILNPFKGERGVFGVPLASAVSRMPSHDGVPLPVVVRQCIDYINEHGLGIEGIYRISAPKSRLDRLEDVANSREPVHLTDVHDAAGLLKRFLRQLPDNVLMDTMRTKFETIAAECPCRSLAACRCLVADLLKAQLSKLPIENYTLLAYIFLHAQRIIAHRQHNKMGIAAMGLILQPTLNISQALVRIFLLNASDEITNDDDSSIVYLFKDVRIMRYVGPREPRSFIEGNLPDSEEELIKEEAKQRSSLNQLHQQIEELREMGLPSKSKEEQMWDVQTAVTLLNRKLKTLRGRRSESVETSERDGPTLQMLEEKQLLAAFTALREEIARCKADIIALESRLNATTSNTDAESVTITDECNESFWRNECRREEMRRSDLVAQIAELRRQCCTLRAKLELNAVKQPALLVTRF
uniref:Rho-GAP domain-containing protein n=2 Tax=Parascaris univalens TaxID=6257 RepID=A0A915BG18_PARUN